MSNTIRPVSEKQLKFIDALLKRHSTTFAAVITNYMKEHPLDMSMNAIEHPGELNSRQAGLIIGMLHHSSSNKADQKMKAIVIPQTQHHVSAKAIDGKPVPTKSIKLSNNCNLEFEAGTNGYKGGGQSKGSRTYFRIKGFEGTGINIKKTSNNEVEIYLSGDQELTAMIKGLRFAARTLKALSEQGE